MSRSVAGVRLDRGRERHGRRSARHEPFRELELTWDTVAISLGGSYVSARADHYGLEVTLTSS